MKKKFYPCWHDYQEFENFIVGEPDIIVNPVWLEDWNKSTPIRWDPLKGWVEDNFNNVYFGDELF